MTTETMEDIKKKFDEARKLQEAGKDEEALSAFGKLLAINPNIAEIHFNIARLFLKNDRPDRASNHAAVACALRPNVPDVWKLRADVVRTLSDLAEAKRFKEQIATVDALDKRVKSELTTSVDLPQRSKPDLRGIPPSVLYSIGGLLEKQRWAEAEKEARSAISSRRPRRCALGPGAAR